MDILGCMDMFLITKILDLAYVQKYMRCLSQNKSDTKLIRVCLFTVFTINKYTNIHQLLHRQQLREIYLTYTTDIQVYVYFVGLSLIPYI